MLLQAMFAITKVKVGFMFNSTFRVIFGQALSPVGVEPTQR